MTVVQGISFSLRLRDVVVEVGEPLLPLVVPTLPGHRDAEPAAGGPLPVYVPRRPADLPASIAVSASGNRHLSATPGTLCRAASMRSALSCRRSPSAPIGLRAGVIIGAERILTDRSGRFGWGDASSADVYV